jgi:small conductance mechanosensitive channel
MLTYFAAANVSWTTTGIKIVVTIIVAIILQLIIKRTVARIVERSMRHHKYQSDLEKQRREDTLTSSLRGTAIAALWIVAIIIILAELHIDFAAILTGAGLIGVLVGFGAQSAMKDFLAGFFIIMENEYRVGDIVGLNTASGGEEFWGVVEDVSLRLTKVRDLDGSLHIMTNGTIEVINNYTYKYGNIVVDVVVSYDSDLNKIKDVINEVGLEVAADDQWKSHIAEAIQFYRVDGFNESSMTIKALGKARSSGMQWMIAGDFRHRLMNAFRKQHIPVPHEHIVIFDEKPHKSTTKKK